DAAGVRAPRPRETLRRAPRRGGLPAGPSACSPSPCRPRPPPRRDPARPLPPPGERLHAHAAERRRGPMTPDVITPDLKAVLWRLKLGRLLDTLPERLALASAAAAPPGRPPPRAQRRGRP